MIENKVDIDFESKLDGKANVSVEVFKDFYNFLMENLFVDLPEGTQVDLAYAFTTFSYLQVRFFIHIPDNNAVLSIIILGSKSFIDKSIHTDYLRSDYAILNNDCSKTLSSPRVFENNFEDFKQTFYQHVIPTVEKHRNTQK